MATKTADETKQLATDKVASVSPVSTGAFSTLPVTPIPPVEKVLVDAGKPIVKIRPIFGQGKTPETAHTDTAKNVTVIARSYEPVIGKIVQLGNSSSHRVFRAYATTALKGYDEATGKDSKKVVESISQSVLLDRASVELATTSLSRIAARHIQNEESMDALALASVAVDYLAGLSYALGELRETRKEIAELLRAIKRTDRERETSRLQS